MIDLGLNNNGKHLYAKQIRQGDKYGLNNCLTYAEPEPLVEFYLVGEGKKPWFVSRYYMLTLLGKCDWSIRSKRTGIAGLTLCGSTGLSATATQVGTACSVSEAAAS